MTKRQQCSGARPDKPTCKHGFVQNAPCFGVCLTVKPMCMREEICGVFFAATGGKPIQEADHD